MSVFENEIIWLYKGILSGFKAVRLNKIKIENYAIVASSMSSSI